MDFLFNHLLPMVSAPPITICMLRKDIHHPTMEGKKLSRTFQMSSLYSRYLVGGLPLISEQPATKKRFQVTEWFVHWSRTMFC